MTVKRGGIDYFLEGTWPGSYLWWSLLCFLSKVRALGLDFTIKHLGNIFNIIDSLCSYIFHLLVKYF